MRVELPEVAMNTRVSHFNLVVPSSIQLFVQTRPYRGDSLHMITDTNIRLCISIASMSFMQYHWISKQALHPIMQKGTWRLARATHAALIL